MRLAVTWLVLAAFWIGLSGHFDLIHLAFGFVSVTLVTALTWRLLTGDGPLASGITALLRLALYLPWLLWAIFRSNVDVLLRLVGVLPVEPVMVRFTPDLESDFAKTALANSITLTPGTVTVDVVDGEFLVHGIAPESTDPTRGRAMVKRLKHVEGRGP